jgi:hypothetical protein
VANHSTTDSEVEGSNPPADWNKEKLVTTLKNLGYVTFLTVYVRFTIIDI